MISDTDVRAEKESVEEENAAMQAAASLGAEQIKTEPTGKVATITEEVRRPKANPTVRRAVLRIVGKNLEAISKDLSRFRKEYQASTGRLEKQASHISLELDSIKKNFSKESAVAAKKQEAYFSKVLGKLEAKPKKKARFKK